ncbi:TetR/AcrR family transcriptional regulator [Nocardiopsis mangrovi]|uniref:TetR/AcrR family transcriptional regulator n=1 Tax=Nocardiopsis mangrovi TaxID=1179818 RepID=A0ABV9DRB3_9ACTN
MHPVIPDGLPLRERKKHRTREALIATALERFTAQGFDGTTLDELCAGVEVSKRTFFRYFAGKEDVALAPTQDMWTAFVAELEARPADGGLLMDLLQDTVLTTIRAMPAEGWAQRVRLSRVLAQDTPSMNARNLQFCDRATRAALDVVRERFGFDPADLRPRLTFDVVLAAFKCGLDEWTRHPGPATRDTLAGHVRDAFAAIPGSIAVEIPSAA